MPSRSFHLLAGVALVFGAARADRSQADLIKLENGGELRGTIEGREGVADAPQVTIRTLSGAVVTVDRSSIRFSSRRPLLVERYESRARKRPDTVEAHWEMAEWCRENRLSSQRDEHLERIVELDPDHERAHYALGHTKRDGVWMSRDEAMRAQGYVKYKGRYVTQQELDLIEKTAEQRAAEREWHGKIRLWKNWLTGRDPERSRDALAELRKVDDPTAVPALRRFFHDDGNKAVRGLYVEILSELPGTYPVEPLVEQSLRDSDYEIRYEALNGLSPDQFEEATNYYVHALKDEQNAIVDRAGAALGRVADERVVPHLIDALLTTHRYKVRVRDKGGTMSFATDGSIPAGQVVLPPEIEGRLRAGGFPHGVIVNNPAQNQLYRTKVVTINYEHRNASVLASLQKFTGEDFGFDERTWRLWWIAKQNGTLKATTIQ